MRASNSLEWCRRRPATSSKQFPPKSHCYQKQSSPSCAYRELKRCCVICVFFFCFGWTISSHHPERDRFAWRAHIADSFISFPLTLQDIPLHVAMLSHLLIAWDRKRWLTDPLKVRLPAFVCSCASWLAGLVIALPYPIYTTYLDLEVSENCFSLETIPVC